MSGFKLDYTASEINARLAQAGKAVCYNILDNSDFRNPVNQRGDPSYSGAKYTIDRWESNSGYGVVTVNSGYINFKSSNGNAVYMQQFIESKVIKSGSPYTVACTLKDGSVHCIDGIASTSMTEAIRYIYVNNANVGTIRFKYDSGNSCYLVMFSTSLTSGIDIVNASLYEGAFTSETLPYYNPKGFGVELAECMRYYQKIRVLAGSTASAAQRQFISLPVEMRATPTVSHEVVDGAAPSALSARDNKTIDITAASSNHSHVWVMMTADL